MDSVPDEVGQGNFTLFNIIDSTLKPSNPVVDDKPAGDWTLPGYNYLGPGNSLDKSAPTNFLDRLALEHDQAYNRATDKSEINSADIRSGASMILWGAAREFNYRDDSEAHLSLLAGSILLGKGFVNTTLNYFNIQNPVPGLNYGTTGSFDSTAESSGRRKEKKSRRAVE